MSNYDWVPFYSEFAEKLLDFKDDRKELIEIIKNVYNDIDIKLPKLEKDNKIVDIDPFTVFGLFNKGITKGNRSKIIEGFTKYITIASPVPSSFRSIPVLMSLNATFYDFIDKRADDDIDNLWNLFEIALDYSDDQNERNKKELINYYNKVIKQRQMGNAKISMGLYWIAPNTFLNLDGTNQEYIYNSNKLPDNLVDSLPKVIDKMKAERYLEIAEKVEDYILDEKSSVDNFQEFSYEAWKYSDDQDEKKIARQDAGKGLPDADVDTPHYWMYSPGPGASKWEEFYEAGIMAIGWSEIGDLNKYSRKSEIINRFQEINDATTSFKNISLATWEFANEMKPGDIIFAKKGNDQLIGRGIVESDYFYEASIQDEFKNRRKVKWTHVGEWIHPGKAVVKTLTDITDYTQYVQNLNAIFKGEIEDEEDDGSEVRTVYPFYSKKDFLNEVFIDEKQYEDLNHLLANKMNIILQGPPGVGKTYMAKRLAYSIIGEKNIERVKMVQFHQSYSYEDFIEGFRPATDGQGFEIKKGAFYQFCRKAEEDIENMYFFIIDEINRGNLSKIFGELLMLIENDKRGNNLQLLYSDEKFSVPSNVYIIGMMNTADRSLAILDYALRRRFAFYNLNPAFQSEGFKEYQNELDDSKFNQIVRTIEDLNRSIKADESLGVGFSIGHSYLSELKNIAHIDLENIIEYEIIPLIQEYWFDEQEKVNEWEVKLRNSIR